MILYHGSYVAIENPDLTYSRNNTDFGKGFYLTPLKAQAESWARRFADKYDSAIVSAYNFISSPSGTLAPNISVLEFDSHNLKWLNFIMECRLGLPNDQKWDLIIGGVANDKVFDTLQLYFDGLIDAEAAIGRLRYNKPNFQYCFKSQALIDDTLTFSGSEVLR